tara:strand:- start:256 stop:1425 length:1170 start_codon:yes stop_codon:yes gene_type:complete
MLEYKEMLEKPHFSKVARVIGINGLVVLVIIFAPAVIFEVYKQTKLRLEPKSSLEKDSLSIYSNLEEREAVARINNQTQDNHKMLYKAFIGWRRPLSDQAESPVIAPYNQRDSLNHRINSSSWFFGNSTMWGTGTSHKYSIPSQYAKITGKYVSNFGESAWTSRQSLNQLLTVLGDGYKPKEVIFYGGAGDILQGCRAELTEVPSHAMSSKLSDVTAMGIKYYLMTDIIGPVIDFTIMPYKAIAGKLGLYKNTQSSSGSTMDCITNPEKGAKVVSHLVSNWKTAYFLARENGARFLAVLQPLAQTSESPTSHFDDEGILLKSQFTALYPKIVENVLAECPKYPGFCKSFVNGQAWVKTDHPVFIDFSHLIGDGNRIVAEKIARHFMVSK